MARDKSTDTIELDRPETATVIPKLIVPMGRGKTGKTSFLRFVYEEACSQGRCPILADADRTNATLGAFFPGSVETPTSADPEDVKEFINAQLDIVIDEMDAGRQKSLLLDIGGGGEFLFKEHARELGLIEYCMTYGIEPVAIHFLGPVIDDLQTLRDMEESGVFSPEKTLIVLAENELAPGVLPYNGFNAVKSHKIFLDAIGRGARAVMVPRLKCIDVIDRNRWKFHEAAAANGPCKSRPTRQYVTMWMREMRKTFSSVSDWLP